MREWYKERLTSSAYLVAPASGGAIGDVRWRMYFFRFRHGGWSRAAVEWKIRDWWNTAQPWRMTRKYHVWEIGLPASGLSSETFPSLCSVPLFDRCCLCGDANPSLRHEPRFWAVQAKLRWLESMRLEMHILCTQYCVTT